MAYFLALEAFIPLYHGREDHDLRIMLTARDVKLKVPTGTAFLVDSGPGARHVGSMATGMELVRKDRELQNRTITQIDRLIPKKLRESGAMTGAAFFRMAAAQLEDKNFDKRTLPAALMTFAMAGILPNAVLRHGYLIVYGKVVTAQFGYVGLLELAMRAKPLNGALVLGSRANTVQNGDRWDDTGSIEDSIRRHRPKRDRNPTELDEKSLIGAYVEFKMAAPVGAYVHEYHVTEWMPAGEVFAARHASAAFRKNRTGSPWFTWPERMARVAVIRRACRAGVVPMGYLAGSVVNLQSLQDAGQMGQYLSELRKISGPDLDHRDGGPGLIEMALPALGNDVDSSPGAELETTKKRSDSLDTRVEEMCKQLGATSERQDVTALGATLAMLMAWVADEPELREQLEAATKAARERVARPKRKTVDSNANRDRLDVEKTALLRRFTRAKTEMEVKDGETSWAALLAEIIANGLGDESLADPHPIGAEAAAAREAIRQGDGS